MYINKIFITFCIITIVITIAIVIISKFNGITRINTTTTPINTDELTTTPINTDELTSTTPSDIQTTPQELTCANKYPKYNSTKLSIGNDKYGSYCMSIDPNSKDLFPTFLGPLKSDINTIYNEMKDNNLYIIKGYNKTFQDNQSDAMFQYITIILQEYWIQIPVHMILIFIIILILLLKFIVLTLDQRQEILYQYKKLYRLQHHHLLLLNH